MTRTVTWGVLGLAYIGRVAVIPALQRARNARLVAIASRTPARAGEEARRLGIPRAYGSYDALLEDADVDAVYIPLPNTLHREWTLRCAAAGKHVLCEKPLAISAADGEAMIAGCRRHGVALMEAFMYRFHPRTERVLQIVAAGGLGEIRFVRASFTYPARDPRTSIRFNPDLGGGALYDVGCYAVNLCRAVLGEPTDVVASGAIGPTGVDEVAAGVLRFDDRRVAVVDCGLMLPRRQEYEIVGSTGHLTVPAPDAFLPGQADATIHLVRGAERQVETVPGVDQYQRMVEHFGDVLSGTRLALPPEDAVGNARTLEALHRSLLDGTRTAVPAR